MRKAREKPLPPAIRPAAQNRSENMNKNYCIGESELKHAEACLIFAQKLGLIDGSGFDNLEKRRAAENEKRAAAAAKGEAFYGPEQFSAPAYLQYELTRFKLDFAAETEQVKKTYKFSEITEKEMKEFYKSNKDLFTRYSGDKFRYREVKLIIKKKIREAQYDNEINNILCKLS